MDEAVFVILLFTGFCISSASFPKVYYFIRQKMTWEDAKQYCRTENTEMAPIHNMENVTEMMNTPTEGYTEKAWIGLYEAISEWTWLNGEQATYFEWQSKQRDYDYAGDGCVVMTLDGQWMDQDCSSNHPYVCQTSDGKYPVSEKEMTWYDAKTTCEKGGNLATILDEETNSKVLESVSRIRGTPWIGLIGYRGWYWSEDNNNYTFANWQSGQPDNVNRGVGCAAVVLTDGTWTDEQCSTMYPFFCYGIYRSRKTVVKMKIESSADLEDPTRSADLLQQLRRALTNQGVTDFKLTWKKLPVKQTQESSDD